MAVIIRDIKLKALNTFHWKVTNEGEVVCGRPGIVVILPSGVLSPEATTISNFLITTALELRKEWEQLCEREKPKKQRWAVSIKDWVEPIPVSMGGLRAPGFMVFGFDYSSGIRHRCCAQNNPANTIDQRHQHLDARGRHWYRHMSGSIYCDGSLILQRLDARTIQATAADADMVETAGKLFAQWGEHG